jgi:L-fuculose-phosphate aldolase
MQAFDRLEVAEFSARALLDTLTIGQLVPIGDQEIEALKAKFL